jgi:hypothetical protein
MKSLIAAFITALAVFILATGWSEVVQPRLDVLTAATSSGRDKVSLENRSRTDISIDDGDEEIEPVRRPSSKSSRSTRQSREAAAQAEKSKALVAQQMEEVKRQEAKLVAREENLRILYDDIRSELAAIEHIRRESATELAMAERKVLDASKSNGVNTAVVNDGGQRTAANGKHDRNSQTYIAGLVQDLASKGSVETAAGLLRGMKDREIAKVLTTLSSRDPQLANQLFEQVRIARQDTTIRR